MDGPRSTAVAKLKKVDKGQQDVIESPAKINLSEEVIKFLQIVHSPYSEMVIG